MRIHINLQKNKHNPNEEFKKALKFNTISIEFGRNNISNEAIGYLSIERDELLKIDGNGNEEDKDKEVLAEKKLEFTDRTQAVIIYI